MQAYIWHFVHRGNVHCTTWMLTDFSSWCISTLYGWGYLLVCQYINRLWLGVHTGYTTWYTIIIAYNFLAQENCDKLIFQMYGQKIDKCMVLWKITLSKNFINCESVAICVHMCGHIHTYRHARELKFQIFVGMCCSLFHQTLTSGFVFNFSW